ncbi:EamA family transporter [Cohnella sp.]|uniref:EamA family transporter n=1 Tax=Cohnella sp. TaxID=1883426 RepID=UPI00356B47B7
MWLVFAAAAAVCFGLRGILYQWTSQKLLDRNLMLLGVFSLGIAVTAIANLFAGQAWSWGALMGVTMGIFSFVSNSAMYKGFATAKASIVAVFTGLPPAVVVIIAYFLWGETLSGWQIGAFIVILLGILVIRYSNELSLSNLRGVQWAIIAMLGFAITDLSSKQSQLWDGEVLPTLTMMFTTGTLLFLISWRRQIANHRVISSLSSASPDTPMKRWSNSRTYLWGMVVGITNVSGMILILPAFKLGVTGLVSAVIATNVLLILLFSRLFLKERFTRLQIAGITFSITGVILLRLLG